METITAFLTDDHRRCDRLFADAEHAVSRTEWDAAARTHTALIAAMEHHFSMEESVLFPAFEGASGSPAGPTQVMRHEHAQMRELFGRLEQALNDRDVEAYLGEAETLLILLQQHNAKEEQILYPMSDRMIEAPSEFVEKMRAELG